MTEEAKKKGIEIGAGILLYIIAFAVTTYWTVPEIAETVEHAIRVHYGLIEEDQAAENAKDDTKKAGKEKADK